MTFQAQEGSFIEEILSTRDEDYFRAVVGFFDFTMVRWLFLLDRRGDPPITAPLSSVVYLVSVRPVMVEYSWAESLESDRCKSEFLSSIS
jgi:hypothetical protein